MFEWMTLEEAFDAAQVAARAQAADAERARWEAYARSAARFAVDTMARFGRMEVAPGGRTLQPAPPA